MATVRFSNALVNDILVNARRQMLPAVNRALGQKPDNSWGQRIYDTLFGPLKPILAQVPDGWLTPVSEMRVVSVAGRRCDHAFTFATPQPYPLVFPTTPLASHVRYTRGVTLEDHPAWAEFAAEVAAYAERVTAAEQRSAEYVSMVTQILTTYTTLAPALKAWPGLWDLLPEAVRDKHREVRDREKKAKTLDVDLNKLTALSTAVKLGL